MVAEAGGRGGKSRAAKQTPKQRSALARKAAKARWAKAKKRKSNQVRDNCPMPFDNLSRLMIQSGW
jgi:hypothetical protein